MAWWGIIHLRISLNSKYQRCLFAFAVCYLFTSVHEVVARLNLVTGDKHLNILCKTPSPFMTELASNPRLRSRSLPGIPNPVLERKLRAITLYPTSHHIKPDNPLPPLYPHFSPPEHTHTLPSVSVSVKRRKKEVLSKYDSFHTPTLPSLPTPQNPLNPLKSYPNNSFTYLDGRFPSYQYSELILWRRLLPRQRTERQALPS